MKNGEVPKLLIDRPLSLVIYFTKPVSKVDRYAAGKT